MNVVLVQHAVHLRYTHTETKDMHLFRFKGWYCTSTTLSNIWAKGRKEMSTSLVLGLSETWVTGRVHEEE